MMKRHSTVTGFTALLLLVLSGCSSQPKVVEGSAMAEVVTPQRPVEQYVDSDVEYAIDIYDPFEGMNRSIYKFNAKFDRYLFLPVVNGYRAVTPDYVEDRVSDFFGNVADLRNLINSVLQLKGERSLKTGFRLVTNTTLGVLGLWDVADAWWDVEPQREDFGQTLGHYGMGQGPYLVLPIFGPSSLRDTTGLVADTVMFNAIDPFNLDDHEKREIAYRLMNAIDTRHNVGFRYYESGSPFEYELVRQLVTMGRKLEIEK